MFNAPKALQAHILAASLTVPFLSGCHQGNSGSLPLRSISRSEVCYPARPEGERAVSLRCERPENCKYSNSCGQVALATVLNSFGHKITANEISVEINPAQIYTSPAQMVNYLESNGIRACQRNQACVEDMAECIDSGRPVIALVSADKSPHWVTVTGYARKVYTQGMHVANGPIVSIEVMDYALAGGSTDGRKEIPVAEFQEKWDRPYKGNAARLVMQHSRLMIEASASENAFNGSPTPVSDILADGTAAAIRGTHRMLKGLRGY